MTDSIYHVANCEFRDVQFPFVIHPPENDLIISRHINQHGSWEPHISDIIVNALTPGGWFVDIGANIGWHTRVVQNAGHNAIAFEPLAINYELLRKNCLKDGSVLYNYALGDQHETQKIVWDTGNYGNSWIAEEGSETIQVVRLDDIIDVSLAAKVDVVKMDVQGFETKVIEGGTKFFDTLHKGAVIVMEVNPTKSSIDMRLIAKLVAGAASSYAMCVWKSEPVSFVDAWKAIMFPEQYNIPPELVYPEFDLVIIK
jgi:FkbM family methyltransferase